MSSKSAAEVGTTTFRPPFTPVTLGAIAGRQTGARYAPRRLLPAHAEHEALGAQLVGSRRLDASRLLSEEGRDGPPGGAARGLRRALRRRPVRRLAARQDRGHGSRRREVPRPLLRQQHREARGGPRPLRADAQRERRHHRRRHGRPARAAITSWSRRPAAAPRASPPGSRNGASASGRTSRSSSRPSRRSGPPSRSRDRAHASCSRDFAPTSPSTGARCRT